MRAVLLLVLLASGHQPAQVQTDFDVPKPKISYAIHGRFETGDEVFVAHLSYDAPFALPFELLTEKRRAYAEFRPRYAVVGPGLPAPDETTRALLPSEVPEGAGVFVDLNDAPERLVIFEGFMRRFYYSSDTTALALGAGDHEVWVWSPDGDPGDFVLGLGVEEDFSGGYGALFADWSTYAY